MTPFALLCQVCGLSQREAAAYLDVRPDTVTSWSSGRRTASAGALAELRGLARQIERAADEAVAEITREGAARNTLEVELGYAADDAEAQSIGWPCVGAQRAMLARVVARAPDGVQIVLVPRGSTPATAGADIRSRSATREG